MNADSTVSNVSSPNLGIVYTSRFIKRALETKPDIIDSSQNYVLVGLLFKKIVEKDINVEALFFNNEATNAFSSVVLNQRNSIFFISNKNLGLNQLKDLKTDENGHFQSISTEVQERIREESSLQFWDIMSQPENSHMSPFVYFGRHTLELLSGGDVKRVSFSGAQITYGNGIRDFEAQAVDSENKSTYPTLKAESNLESENNHHYIPYVTLGQPCPPLWGSVSRSVNALTNSQFLLEIKRNFDKYSESRSLRELTLAQMMDNWKSFVNNKAN